MHDYRIRSSAENAAIAGGSAFNVRAESLRLGDFTEAEVCALVAQHTEETGQTSTREALDAVWTGTRGQPWLVNALCRRACFDTEAGRDRSRATTRDDLLDARDHLIVSRQVHLDQLADKLREDRVWRAIEPLLSGASEDESSTHPLTRKLTDQRLRAAPGDALRLLPGSPHPLRVGAGRTRFAPSRARSRG